jgi:polyisoprenyl-phosphate glycosyltransferase
MISVVIPIHNEEQIIPVLHEAVSNAMRRVAESWEIVYVNDGSKDSSFELLRKLQATEPEVVVIDLSRNWGHMGALHAGLQTARGDAIVLMNGDLQDPPEIVPEMVDAWRGGAQVVTALRRNRQERGRAVALLSSLFYRLLGAISDFPIPLNAGIFGLLDRKVLDSIGGLREGNRYLPGLRAWVGYRTAVVHYVRQDRGGEGQLSFPSRIKYAMDAITSFSYKPLRLSFAIAGMGFVAAFALGLTALVSQANSSTYCLFAVVFLMSSFPVFCMGILGEYLGRVYDEVRQRPLSIINQVYRSESTMSVQEIDSDILDAAQDPAWQKQFPAA